MLLKILNNKKLSIVFLAILALFGSFVTFYTTNLWMHDVANNFFGVQDAGAIISACGFMFTFDIVALTLFIIRIYRRPEYKKALIKHYSLLIMIFSGIGFVCSILTGTIMYGTFLAPYPFAGYTILCLVIHAFIIAGCIYIRFFAVKKLPEDENKRVLKGKYVWYSILLSFMVFWAYNRFGALLWAPEWYQARTLYLTWPFFIYLALPMLWLAIVVIRIFPKTKTTIIATLDLAVLSLVLNVVLGIVVCVIGSQHTEFISAISPALGLERLASLPIDTIIHLLSGIGLSVYETIYAIKLFKRNK